jgi:hypothetical protein
MLLLATLNVNAAGSIIGKWEDKTDPDKYRYEFKKGHDFIYTYLWDTYEKTQYKINKGVWELGEWTITNNKTGAKDSCDLTVYAGSNECCYQTKFIANNLILSVKHGSGGYGMCSNRVLVKEK